MLNRESIHESEQLRIAAQHKRWIEESYASRQMCHGAYRSRKRRWEEKYELEYNTFDYKEYLQ